ncbi:hypothetical protein V2J09_005174 [Rumex salicifolius]
MSRSQSPPTATSAAAADSAADPTPLLTSSDESSRSPGGIRRGVSGVGRRTAMRTAARMIRRVGNRQAMGESSMRVREVAAEQIEERQSDWAYSRPIVVLDLVWNTMLLLASLSVLVVSRDETTSVPLKLWIIGHGIQCAVHMVCVCVEYRRRQKLRLANRTRGNSGTALNLNGSFISPRTSSSSSLPGNEDAALLNHGAPTQIANQDDTSVAKHVESANTMFTFIWWIIGFYWVSSGGSTLIEDAPELYWICIAFLALDVVFVVICVFVACLIGIAVCFCLPCIIAILYAVADQEGATTEDIEQLPRFIFRTTVESEKDHGEIVESRGGIIFECDVDNPEGSSLPAEDATCVICLSEYEDKTELRQLPCRHLFHSTCIDKWLCINATCPLCKGSILKNGEQIGPEQA